MGFGKKFKKAVKVVKKAPAVVQKVAVTTSKVATQVQTLTNNPLVQTVASQIPMGNELVQGLNMQAGIVANQANMVSGKTSFFDGLIKSFTTLPQNSQQGASTYVEEYSENIQEGLSSSPVTSQYVPYVQKTETFITKLFRLFGF